MKYTVWTICALFEIFLAWSMVFFIKERMFAGIFLCAYAMLAAPAKSYLLLRKR